MNAKLRLVTVTLGIAATALVIWSTAHIFRRPQVPKKTFDSFYESVSGDTNRLQRIVTWARGQLETNIVASNAVMVESASISADFAGLYSGPDADVVRPAAFIRHAEGRGNYVGIYFVPGGTWSFAILIGNRAFIVPSDPAKYVRRVEEGVYVVGSW